MQQEVSTVQKLINTVIEFFVNYSFQLVGAVLILIAGFMMANWAAKFSFSLFQKRKIDLALSKFLSNCLKITVLAFAIVIALGKVGITITPFIATLSAAVFGASFAIQGTLSNYGAGLSIIFSRPFAIGDTITVKDVTGVVEDIKLQSTILTNADSTRITIPNKHMVGEIIHNSYTNKVSNSVIGVGYGSDMEKAIGVIQEVLRRNPDVAKTPEPQIGIREFADSAVNIGYRYWAPGAKYFQTVSAVNLAIFKAFKRENIEIPFPQREVRIVSQSSMAS